MSNKKQMAYRYTLYVIGLFIFAFGISFSIRSQLGGNPMSVMVEGLSIRLPQLSFGTWNLIVGLVQVIIGFIFDKKNITFATWLGLVAGSYAIDLGNWLIPVSDSTIVHYVYMIVGVLIYCLGIAIQIQAKAGLSNLDCFIFGIMKATKIDKYRNVRWMTDGAFLILGFFLGGTIGLGTIFYLFATGSLIELFGKWIKPLLKLEN